MVLLHEPALGMILSCCPAASVDQNEATTKVCDSLIRTLLVQRVGFLVPVQCTWRHEHTSVVEAALDRPAPARPTVAESDMREAHSVCCPVHRRPPLLHSDAS